jgi:hypothetical protein
MTPADCAIILAAAADCDDARPADGRVRRYVQLLGRLDAQRDELGRLARAGVDVAPLLAEIEDVRADVSRTLVSLTHTIH